MLTNIQSRQQGVIRC